MSKNDEDSPRSTALSVDSNIDPSSKKSEEGWSVEGQEDEGNSTMNVTTPKDTSSSTLDDSPSGEENDIKCMPAEERFASASSCKDEGNRLFKETTFVEAFSTYNRGQKFLEDITPNVEITQVKVDDLKKALWLNISAAALKLEKWHTAITNASAVIAVDAQNTKALYRRGFAYKEFGLLDEAKADLSTVVTLEPNNHSAKAALLDARKKLKEHQQENKKAYSGLFDKTAGLYEDRQKEAEAKKADEEMEREKKRNKWHDVMNERCENGEQETPFEEWEKEENKKEEEARREAENKRQRDRPKKPASTTFSNNIDTGLDEEDHKIMSETKKMGYCYFRRDLTEEEKQLNAQHLPQRIISADVSPQIQNSPQQPNVANKNTEPPPQLSSWNAAGTTYEERDRTQWAKTALSKSLGLAQVEYKRDIGEVTKNMTKLLESSLFTPESGSGLNALEQLTADMMSATCKAERVIDVEGEAHTAVVRGTLRYIFDMSATVKFTVVVNNDLPEPTKALLKMQGNQGDKIDKGPQKFEGEIKLEEIASDVSQPQDWIKGHKLTLKRVPPSQMKPVIDATLESFKKRLVERISAFMEEFKQSV